jgi:hypothetical protein
MTPLPIIRGTSTALYPFTQTYVCLTGISDAQSGAPSRWVKGPPLVRFEFHYDPIRQGDKNTLKAAFASAKGQFATNLSATPATEYDYLSLDADEFSATEQKTTQYGIRWTLTQTLPQNWTPGASGAAFPALSTSAIAQLPYTQKKRWQTIVSKLAAGPKYTYAEYAGGLSNFPTDGLMAWEFSEGQLTDSEVTGKVAHFLANWGDCFPFQFTDEDGTIYSNVYYASPELTIVRAGVNQSSIKTALVQMN